MNRLMGYLLLSSLVLGCLGTIAAQESSGMHQPPKVLNIIREYPKPGKGGMAHEKTEAAFVQALRAANWKSHYIAVDSLSGKPRSLFLAGYDSFEAMEKDMAGVEKNPKLAAALDHAGAVDGELLSDTDAGDFAFREDMSLRPGVDLPHIRYFEISLFHVKPGHDKDWEALVKMYQQGFDRIQDAHWAMYEAVFGQQDGTFVVFEPMKSLAEVDRDFGEGKDFESALGEDGMKKLHELYAVAIESSQTNLFAVNPRMSYVDEGMMKADEFWKPKAPAAMKEKKEEKGEKKQ
ncbi:MAG TPA: hypothetical protein VMI10_03100 [Terriglobales bacterium]|nr:hypothetical protein [Terriglobales bacterium]